MMFLAGILLVGLGLLSIFAKDFMWNLTQISNQMKGVASERTDWWDTSTTIGGIVAIVLGLVTFVLAFRG